MNRSLPRVNEAHGFTMALTMGVLMVASLLALAAFGAAKGDITGSASSRDRKIAYAAAEAGQQYYYYQLAANPDYWTNCTNVTPPSTTEASPVSQTWDGVTPTADPRSWRRVDNTTTNSAEYTIELLPAPGKAACDTANPETSMIDPNTGTFRVRSTGRYHGVKRSIVTTFRRKSFLDFLYFTDFENLDPAVWGGGSSCTDKYRPQRSGCREIQFADFDEIKGPLHSNDSIWACNSPGFGRVDRGDDLETAQPDPGWYQVCAPPDPEFRSDWHTGVEKMTMPSTNTTLLQKAQSGGIVFQGTTFIRFNASGTMTVRNTKLNNMVATDYALPGNGVIYVTSIAGATCTQTPQSITYSGSGSDGDGCADVYISGTYAGSMTIGSAKDIIIRPTASPAAMAANPALQTDGDLKRADGSSWLLGLIANNYVRVYHPCTGGTNTSPVMNTVRIDAAILSLLHSFIADNWACGAQLDALTVNGAIAQKYRGTVGTSGGTGFKKDYNYDDRFKFRSPPFFLDPVAASWRILKAHEQMPAR